MSIYTISFPGVRAVVSGSYTLNRGIAPSVVTLTVAPQDNLIARVGDVVFYENGNPVLTIADCAVDSSSVTKNSGGQIVTLSLFDRRWRWQFKGIVSGRYNQRDADSRIIQETLRTRQQLVTICLQAMGETAAGIGLVPGNPSNAADTPEVDWLADNPAYSLAQLLQDCSLELVMKTNGSLEIVRPGQGQLLPVNGFLIEAQQTTNPPEVPSVIRAVGGPTEVEGRLPLEAVGRDRDGKWRLIDDLDYKPATGWGTSGDWMFLNITDTRDRKLASETVWRCYRVKDTGIPAPPGFPAITSRRQILPIFNRKLESITDDNGEKRPLPSQVVGIYWIHNISTPINSTLNSYYVCHAKHAVEENEGIIIFDREIKKWDTASKKFVAADVYIDCVYRVADATTFAYHHMYYDLAVSGGSGGMDVIKPDDTRRYLWEQRRAEPQSTSFTWRLRLAEAELLEQLRSHAMARAASYPIEVETQGRYAGLLPIQPDGAIEQVTWEIGPPTTTTASRNGEHSSYLAPKRTRKLIANLRRADMQDQLRKRIRGRGNRRGRDDG